MAIECKASVAPTLSKGNYAALDDIAPISTYVTTPVSSGYPISKGIQVVSLSELIKELGRIMGLD